MSFTRRCKHKMRLHIDSVVKHLISFVNVCIRLKIIILLIINKKQSEDELVTFDAVLKYFPQANVLRSSKNILRWDWDPWFFSESSK